MCVHDFAGAGGEAAMGGRQYLANMSGCMACVAGRTLVVLSNRHVQVRGSDPKHLYLILFSPKHATIFF